MKRLSARSISIGILSLILLATVGCNDVTPENYAQLQIGMSYEAVVDLLGKPDSCESAVGFKDCTWGGKEKYINVKFGGGNVVFFSSKGI